MGFYGDLVDLPLQDILYVISRHGKSGILTLESEALDITLEFDKARLASLTLGDGSLRIGQLLVSHGYATRDQIDQALGLQSVSEASSRIGELLSEVGFVTIDEIQQAVSSQLHASLFRILMQEDGTFGFEPGPPPPVDPVMSGVRLERIVIDATRMSEEWKTVEEEYGAVVLADVLVDSAMLESLATEERALVMAALNGDSTPDLLALRTGLTAEEFKFALEQLCARGVLRTVSPEDLEPEPSDRLTRIHEARRDRE